MGTAAVAASDCARNEASAAWIGATIILAPRGSSGGGAAAGGAASFGADSAAIAVAAVASASAAAASFTAGSAGATTVPHECPPKAPDVWRAFQPSGSEWAAARYALG